jgi:hypothetical protein
MAILMADGVETAPVRRIHQDIQEAGALCCAVLATGRIGASVVLALYANSGNGKLEAHHGDREITKGRAQRDFALEW